jgi:hypothetical protein
MYYLLYAVILSIVLFMIVQYVEKNKRLNTDDEYDVNVHLFTMNNLVVFFMILLLNTIIFYYTLDNGDEDDIMSMFNIGLEDVVKKDNKKEIKIKNSSKLDPTILKRINDPLKHGFEPMSDNDKSDDNIYDEDSSDSSSYDDSNYESEASSIHVKKSKK